MEASMEIKPVGRERDIQIGIIRDRFSDDHDKCWSTNRNDVWELFEELYRHFAPQHYNVSVECWYDETSDKIMKSVRVTATAIHSNCGENIIFTTGDTEADCVSQSWLTWKGNQ